MINNIITMPLKVKETFTSQDCADIQPIGVKKEYSKPFLLSEKFVPQEFVALCEKPNKKFSIYSPHIENGKENGYQSSGKNKDDSYNGWYLYFDSYEQSYENSIYITTLKSVGIMRKKQGNNVVTNENSPFPIGTITYMSNYNPIANVTPNHS